MQTVEIGYIRQVVTCGIFFMTLMMVVNVTLMSAVSARDEDLPPEIRVDIIMNSAKKDILAGKWKDAVLSLERAVKLGVNLPGEFHFLYGKALFKMGDYDKSLSSLTSYLTLTGRDGEYYEEAVTLVVDAGDEREAAKRRSSESEGRQAEAAGKTEGDMVFIKGGCFDMGDIFGDGSSDEKPVHAVCVGDFYLGKTEVTQKQWVDIVGHNPSRYQCGDCPVERVSWEDVQDFIRKLNQATGMNFRLPTEAEWEYAARNGGWKEKWAGAGTESELGEYAWYGNNSDLRSHPVAQKKPNGLGLYDMLGNVWEWCSDWYGTDYYEKSPDKDPEGPPDGSNRVIRGGSFRSKPGTLRTTDRNDFAPDKRNFSNMGFRLARSP